MTFIRKIKNTLGVDVKLGIFVDNASIHKSKSLKTALALSELNVEIFYNLPYRPDLNGIEQFWGYCKRAYRKTIVKYLATHLPFCHMGVVTSSITGVKAEHTIKSAAKGWSNLLAA